MGPHSNMTKSKRIIFPVFHSNMAHIKNLANLTLTPQDADKDKGSDAYKDLILIHVQGGTDNFKFTKKKNQFRVKRAKGIWILATPYLG